MGGGGGGLLYTFTSPYLLFKQLIVQNKASSPENFEFTRFDCMLVLYLVSVFSSLINFFSVSAVFLKGTGEPDLSLALLLSSFFDVSCKLTRQRLRNFQTFLSLPGNIAHLKVLTVAFLKIWFDSLSPNQQFFTHLGTGLPVFNHY